MNADLPIGKIGRALTSGHTAAKIGGQMLSYYTKRPFLSPDKRQQAKQETTRKSAETLFRGLSLLRGTALKMAQQLSLETDLLPESACRELAKAYHQVPPINRALVRKVVGKALGSPPEKVFRRFDLTAFAAASLGQVHYAEGHDNQPLAVKIQYPGIARTIAGDVGLLRQLFRPLVQRDQLNPAIDELAARLSEEVDYLKEAEHVAFFAERLKLAGVRTPTIKPHLSSSTVLSTTMMPGRPMDIWLKDNPGQADRDRIAQTLHNLFLTGLYELNVIHADPNPGNFIIGEDLAVGVVDFGCVKRLKPDFVEAYRQLAVASAHHDNGAHFRLMITLDLLPGHLSKAEMEAVKTASDDIGDWFGRLYTHDYFDFGVHSDFVADGKAILRRFHHLRRHFKMNPEFIFMDRTRYGLLRLFETMGARVKFRNAYEW